MSTETALPAAGQPAEVSVDHSQAEQLATSTENTSSEHSEGAEASEGETKAKPEKTPQEREVERLRRALDRKTKQLYQARATQQVALTNERDSATKPTSQADDEPLTLSRAELHKLVNQRAEELAPSIRQQREEIEHRSTVVQTLAKEWGQEKFNAMASDLDDALGGLQDGRGQMKPITEAIFESESPRALIEYLADPDNAEEAESLSRMGAVQAGRAVAKIEAKLAADKGRPKPSSASAPLEAVKGNAKSSGMPDPSNTKAYIKWANEQERSR